MNFFAHQAQARTQTKRLVFLFALAVLAIIAAINLMVLVAFASQKGHGEGLRSVYLMHPAIPIWTTLITLAVIGCGSMFKTAALRGGGGAVAQEFGATLVGTETTNFQHRRLRNVVEEIAIASGVPVPEIYVLDDEQGINAFAAGFTPADAAVCVTRGCLERLSRDELQGVIAHEFSHVLNGDMRLNIRLMGILFGILLIALAGQKVLENTRGGDRDRGGAAILAVALGLMIVGYIGLFFGRLIKAGVSRQREFLADASAVQFTRQPLGIAGALKKIAALPEGSLIAKDRGEEVSHMLFGDGVGFSSMFATHPRLVDRIKRIEPSFREEEVAELAKSMLRKQQQRARDAEAEEKEEQKRHDALGGLGRVIPGVGAMGQALPGVAAAIAVAPNRVVGQVGAPQQDDFAAAGQINDTIPDELRKNAYQPDRAPGLVLALALDANDALRARQVAAIAAALDPSHADVAAVTQPLAAKMHPMHRLPLAAMAFPALRRLPKPFLAKFVEALSQVIHADGAVALSEYCLATLVRTQVIDALDPSRARVIGRKKLRDVRDEVAALFGVFARDGHDDPEHARRAYLVGIATVIADAPAFAPPSDWIAKLDVALPALDLLEPAGKELLIGGLVKTMSHDGKISVAESELLRTVCAALHCPLPPVLA